MGASAIAALLAATPAVAADAADGAERRATARAFAIEAQPLGDALTAFGMQSGLQVSIDGAVVGTRRSPGVTGTQTPERALDSLLSGTGMTWRFSESGSVVVEPAATVPATMVPAAEDAMVLPPVTVAGERVSRSLMETASSVAVIDSRSIESTPGAPTLESATDGIANVVVIPSSNHAPVIRALDGAGPAVGAVAFFAGARPRLTLQMDGRPASFNELLFGDAPLWDVEQVEVFRGPQSTIQGRNSIAGAIVVKSKDPTYTPEAKVRAGIANHDGRTASAMVSGPIVADQVAARLAIDHQTSASELPFRAYSGETHPDEFHSTTLRGKLLVEPRKLDGFRTLLTLTHSDYKGPQGEWVKRPFEAGAANQPQVATFNPRTTSGIVETSWELTDALTFENRLALTDLKVRRHSLPKTGNVRIDGIEGVVEPRLRFRALDSRLTGFGGFYGERAMQDEFIDMGGGNDYTDRTQTNALFGEGTLAVTPAFDVTAGIRLEEEARQRHGGRGNYQVNFDETYRVFLPKLGVAWHLTDAVTVGSTVSRGYNGGGAGITFAAPLVSFSYDPEYVWNYEAFTRAELLDGALRLTGNVFYADYKDLQLPYRLAVSSVAIRNAERARVYGSELGARWRVTPELELWAEIGMTQTEILRYPGSGLEGNQLPQAPAFTGTIGTALHPIERLEVGADARYSEAYYSDVFNTPRGRTDPYWVVNLNTAYDLNGLRLYGYIRNLFDTKTPIDITLATASASDSAVMLKPRTFGLGAEVSF